METTSTLGKASGIPILALWASLIAFGQNITGSLAGSVQDSSGAAFAGAEVKLTNTQTGFTRVTRTNLEGYFSFPDLTPGTYDLEIRAEGFKQYRQEKIEINSGDSRSMGAVKLELGALTETVTVSAESTAVALGGSERVGVLNSEDIANLALRGRDFMDAIGLLPGVVDTNESREAPNPGSVQGIFIAGARDNSKNITIDGVTNMDTGNNNAVHNMPSMDSVAEVSVKMTNYGAENGRNAGGAINIITRGGSKQFRASAGWYHRHESFNANNYFNNRQGLDRPPYRYNIAGYTVSGPVVFPHFNTSRSKLFFFFSQEFQRQLQAFGTTTVRVPTALERAGDFSQSMDVNGRLIVVRDPLDGPTPGRQFPGNVVPASRHTQVGKAILNLFPMPNFVDPDPSRLYQWNYIAQRSGPYPRHTEIIRTDYSPRPNFQMYVRLSNNGDALTQPYNKGAAAWVTGSMNFPLTPVIFERSGRGGTVHTTATLSPSLINVFIFGVSQNKLVFYPKDPEALSRKATGIDIPQWNSSVNPMGWIPNMTFSSVPNYANPSVHNSMPYYNTNTIFNFVENLSKIYGTHSITGGVYLERTRKDQSSSAPIRGAISFDRNQNVNPLDTNYAYATALLGYYNSYQEANAWVQGHYRYTNFEWFIKDQWRVRSGFTVDYGVRFYRDMPEYDKRKQIAAFAPDRYDPANAPLLLRPAFDSRGRKVALNPRNGAMYSQGLIGTYAPGFGNPAEGMVLCGKDAPAGCFTLPPVSLAPRFGFAWDPFLRHRTRVHGGFGVYFDRVMGNTIMNLMPNPPTIFSPTVYFGAIEDLRAAAGQGILGPTNVISIYGKGKSPTMYNFSFGVQHQISRGLLADVSYVGSMGRHLLWRRNINAVPVGAQFLDLHPENRDPTTTNTALAANFLRPLQGYGNINLSEFAGTSSYNSLQVRVVRRMSRGLMAQFSYTFSKALGATSTDTQSINIFGISPRLFDYGPLTFDRKHVASLSYTYMLPKPGRSLRWRKLGYVTDGWQISGVTRLQTGAPFTPGWTLVSGSTNMTGTPTQNARISVLDPSAPPRERFRPPDKYTFGNAGSGILRLPGMNSWDLSLYRNLRVWERLNMQLRWETYNTPNHTQFSNVSQQAKFASATDWTQVDPLFLEPTAARAARTMQLAVRLTF